MRTLTQRYYDCLDLRKFGRFCLAHDYAKQTDTQTLYVLLCFLVYWKPPKVALLWTGIWRHVVAFLTHVSSFIKRHLD